MKRQSIGETKPKAIHTCLECAFDTEDLCKAKEHAVEEKHYAWGVRYKKERRA